MSETFRVYKQKTYVPNFLQTFKDIFTTVQERKRLIDIRTTKQFIEKLTKSSFVVDTVEKYTQQQNVSTKSITFIQVLTVVISFIMLDTVESRREIAFENFVACMKDIENDIQSGNIVGMYKLWCSCVLFDSLWGLYDLVKIL